MFVGTACRFNINCRRAISSTADIRDNPVYGPSDLMFKPSNTANEAKDAGRAENERAPVYRCGTSMASSRRFSIGLGGIDTAPSAGAGVLIVHHGKRRHLQGSSLFRSPTSKFRSGVSGGHLSSARTAQSQATYRLNECQGWTS